MEILIVLMPVAAFIFGAKIFYQVGESSSLGKVAKYDDLPRDRNFKVIYSDKTRTILESTEEVPVTYTIDTSDLPDRIGPGTIIIRKFSGKKFSIGKLFTVWKGSSKIIIVPAQ